MASHVAPQTSVTVADVMAWMERVAPLDLSESWDNTGLLLGDPMARVERTMTCLTLTPQSVAEAVREGADLVLAHHPLPFKPVSRITTETQSGGLLYQLLRAGINVYSPHTAWDSAPQGINARLAEQLGLCEMTPLIPHLQRAGLGAGRIGKLLQPLSLRELSERVVAILPEARPRGVEAGRRAERVAIACGSGGSLLPAAIAAGCDAFLTGEATYHTCLEAQAAGISLLMVGHFASECFAMRELAQQLHQQYPGLSVWASRDESDPVIGLS